MIFKIFHIRYAKIYCKLYKIYILPIVLYCLPVYFTDTKFCIKYLEKIQRYYSKRVFKRCVSAAGCPDYITRIKTLNMPSLESLCVKNDLCTLFKLINKSIEIEFEPCFSSHNPSRLIYHSLSTTLYHNSFFRRSLLMWNKFISTHLNPPFSDFSSFIHTINLAHSNVLWQHFYSFLAVCAFIELN